MGTNEDDRNERSDGSFTRRLVGRIPDVMNRALVAGTGALFLTEEGIRSLVSELKLPGEVVKLMLQQAESTKKELFRLVGQEIRSFLEQSNLSQELVKVLSSVTLDIHTTIRFVPDPSGAGIKPSVQSVVDRVSFDDSAEGGGEPQEPKDEEDPGEGGG